MSEGDLRSDSTSIVADSSSSSPSRSNTLPSTTTTTAPSSVFTKLYSNYADISTGNRSISLERDSSSIALIPDSTDSLSTSPSPPPSTSSQIDSTTTTPANNGMDVDIEEEEGSAIGLTRSDVLTRVSVADMLANQKQKEDEEDRLEALQDELDRKARLALHSSTSSSASEYANEVTANTSLESASSKMCILDAISAALPPLPLPSLPLISHGTSSDEDEEEEESVRPQKLKSRRVIATSSSDADSDNELPSVLKFSVSTTSTAKTKAPPLLPLTKEERLAALVKKRAGNLVVEEDKWDVVVPMEGDSEVENEVIEDVSSDEGKGKRKNGKKSGGGKKKSLKGLNKKSEEEMNRETERLKREQNIYLERGTRNPQSVLDAVNNAPKSMISAPVLPPHKAPSTRPITSRIFPPTKKVPVVILPSSSSSSSAIQGSTPQTSNSHHTRTIDTTSPIAPTAPPPHSTKRKVVIIPKSTKPIELDLGVESNSDNEDELDADLNVAFEKRKERIRLKESARIKAENLKAWGDKKRQAALTMLLDGAEDDDSDLDIEGAPFQQTSTKIGGKKKEEIPRLTQSARKFRNLAKIDKFEPEEEVTESQFERAGKTYGKNLGNGNLELLMGKPKKSTKKVDEGDAISEEEELVRGKDRRRKKRDVEVTQDGLNSVLLSRTREQNHTTTTKKRLRSRRKLDEKVREERKLELSTVDVHGLMKGKAVTLAAAVGGAEEDDEDYIMGDDVEDEDDKGSVGGSEDEYEASGGSGSEIGKEEEEEFDSSIPPPSSQPDTSANPPTRRRSAIIQDDDDEEEEEEGEGEGEAGDSQRRRDSSDEGEEPVAPVHKVQMFGAGDDDGGGFGFTQLFGDDFSQSNDVAGFQLPSTAKPLGAPQPTFAPPLVDDEDLEQDYAMLEAQEEFRLGGDFEQTPRQVHVAPRRYINKHGLFTQTRPAHLFGESPSDSPEDSLTHSNWASRSATTSGTDRTQISQTQLEGPDTPTQPPKRGGLVRTHALISFPSQVEPDPMDLEPPSAGQAQPALRNAFDIITAVTKPAEEVVVKKKGKGKSMFVDTEADLSDDEVLGMGMGGDSGDEDENGLDAELESLVDNDEVNEEVQAEQDLLAQQLHAEELAKEDAKNEARMKGIADGKERIKRKNGGLDLSDDEFDDDGYGVSKRIEKKRKVHNSTMEDLEANEETQAFAKPLKDGLIVPLKDGECDFLTETQNSDDDEDRTDVDDDADEYEDYASDSAPRRHGRGPERISVRDAERTMLEPVRGRLRSLSPRLYTGVSSSPDKARDLKIKYRTASVVIAGSTSGMEVDFDDSKHLLTRKYSSHTGPWDAATKEESQGSTNGQTSGKNSAVTSFKKERAGATSVHGGTLSGGSHGKMTVTTRTGTLARFRKNNFAT